MNSVAYELYLYEVFLMSYRSEDNSPLFETLLQSSLYFVRPLVCQPLVSPKSLQGLLQPLKFPPKTSLIPLENHEPLV